MNTTIDTIMARRSIRAFTPEALTKEQTEALVNVALASPTATNSLNWHFSFIQDTDIILEMEKDIVDGIMNGDIERFKERTKERGYKAVYDATTFVIISAAPTKYSHIDAGIAVQSLAIAAKAMGLESVILGLPALVFDGPKSEYWTKKLNFPEGFEFVISIAIGHGAMQAPTEKTLDSSKVSFIS